MGKSLSGVGPRATTGSELCGTDGNGNLGTLSIQNGTRYDAVVALFPVGAASESVALRCMYVRAGESFTAQHISPGEYELRFSLGTYWNATASEFVDAASLLRFIEPLRYTETSGREGSTYMKNEVTLQPVLNGNARTEQIDRSLFRLPRTTRTGG